VVPGVRVARLLPDLLGCPVVPWLLRFLHLPPVLLVPLVQFGLLVRGALEVQQGPYLQAPLNFRVGLEFQKVLGFQEDQLSSQELLESLGDPVVREAPVCPWVRSVLEVQRGRPDRQVRGVRAVEEEAVGEG